MNRDFRTPAIIPVPPLLFSDVFILADDDWCILRWQRDDCVEPQFAGRTVWECFPVDEDTKAGLLGAATAGQALSVEGHSHGGGKWYRFSIHPFGDRISLQIADITGVKENESRWLRQQEQFEHLLDLWPGMAWQYDIASGHACWLGNKLPLALQCGVAGDAVLNWEENVHPEDLPGVQQRFRQALETGASSFSGAYRLRNGSGAYLHVKDRAYVFRNDLGVPVQVMGIMEDVTEEQLYKEVLSEARKSLLALFNCAPEPKVIYDPGTYRVLQVNDAALKQYGYNREAFLEMYLQDLSAPGDVKVSDFCSQEAAGRCEVHRKKDGNFVLVEAATAELVYERRAVRMVSFVDVTEQQRVQLAQKQLEEKLLNILETTGDCFFEVSRNWEIRYLNAKAEQNLLLDKSKVVGKNLWDLFHAAIPLKFYSEYQRAMNDRVAVRFEEYYPPLETWFEVNAYPTEEGLSIFFHNINHRKEEEAERRKNAERLRKSEEELKHVLEAMSDGFYTLDRNWNFVYVTDKLCEIMGMRKEALLGRNVWELYPGASGLAFYEAYHRAFREGSFVSFEEHLPRANRWVQVNAYPYEDVLAVFMKDITEQKLDKQRLEFIARATSEVVWETQLETQTSFINVEKFLAVFGHELPPGLCHYAFWRSKIHPDDLPEVSRRSSEAIELGMEFFVHEYRFQKADGSWAFVKDRSYVVKDVDRRPVKLIGAMQDITAEKLAARSLQEREQSYRELFDNGALPKIVYDRETLQILNVNNAAVEAYGYSRKEFTQLTIVDIRLRRERKKAKEAARTVHARQELGTWTHIRKDGSKMQVEVSAAPIYYQGHLCIISMMLDVTEKLKLQQALTAATIERQQSITRATLQAQENERTEIGRELHDGINQMLTTAKLYVENASYYPERSEAFLGRSLDLLQGCIQDIRNMARSLVTPAFTGFKEGLGDLVRSYEELKVFEVQCRIETGVDALEKEVQLSVYRIIQEQLNNVVKYAGASKVCVNVSEARGVLTVVVQDDGSGFDLKKKKTGIGLNNMRARAEVFGGTMKIRTKAGQGCRMEVRIPVATRRTD